MNPQYFDIIIFGGIALFFIFKLIKSLGVRPDGREDGGFGEQDNRKEFSENNLDFSKDKTSIDNVVVMPLVAGNAAKKSENAEDELAASNSEEDEMKSVFYRIYSIDDTFHPDKFLEGAKKAFSFIIEAYGKDDEETLKSLVDDKVFAKFKMVLDGYKEKGQTLEQTLIGMKNAKIEKAVLDGYEARLTVRFETEQAMVIKDSDGKIVEGDTVMMSNVNELWTFSRNLKSSSPNWILVSVKGC